jgi:ketosteroid isomerase-like protein
VQLQDLGAWLDRYFAAWASNDPDDVEALFSEDAVYSYSPFKAETRGRDAIVREWVEGGLGEDFTSRHEPLAVTGNRGIAHWSVSSRDAGGAVVELDGIFVLDFDDEGRCSEHREWYVTRTTPTNETSLG